MIAHLVFFKLKDEHQDSASRIKAELEALPPKIEQIQRYEVGINEVESPRAFDLSLYSTFESYDEMQTYQDHPDHQAALRVILPLCAQIHSVDYTLD